MIQEYTYQRENNNNNNKKLKETFFFFLPKKMFTQICHILRKLETEYIYIYHITQYYDFKNHIILGRL